MKNIELGTRIIACSVVPRPLSVLQRNVTVSFTLEEVGSHFQVPLPLFLKKNSVFLGSIRVNEAYALTKINKCEVVDLRRTIMQCELIHS